MAEAKPWEEYAPTEEAEAKPWEEYKPAVQAEAKPWEEYKQPEVKEEPGFFGKIVQSEPVQKTLEFLQSRKNPQELLAEINAQVKPEERQALDQEALKTPVISGKVEEMRVLPSELQGIARKHDIPVSKLTDFDWSAFFGAPMATAGGLKGIGGELAQVSEGFVGSLSEAVAMGLPQKLAIEAQRDPKVKAALEDLRTLALYKKSGLLTATELVGGIKTGFGLANVAGAGLKALGAGEKAVAAGKIATGAGEAALAGYAGAETDYESKAALIGLGLGGVINSSVELFGLIKNARAQKAAVQAEKEWLENPDSTALITQEVAKTQNAQKVIDDVIEKAVAAKSEDEVKALSKQINDSKELPRLFGQGTTDAEITQSGQKIIDTAADEIFSSLDKEGQRRVLSELKDSRLLDENNVVTPFGKSVIVQKYLDQNLPKIVEKYGQRSEGIQTSLDYLRTRAGEGADFLKQEFRRVMEQNAANKLMAEDIIRKAGVGEGDGRVLRNLAQSLVDGQFVLRGIDRRTGTRLEPLLNKMNFQYNAFTRMLSQVIKDRELVNEVGEKVKVLGLESLDKMRQAANLTQEDLYKFLDKGIKEIPDTNKAQVVAEYRKWFEQSRKLANEQGLNIADFTQKYGGYVPHMVLDRTEIAKRLRDTVADLQERFKINLLDYKTADYDRAAATGLREDANYRSLKESLEYLNGTKITSPEEMNQILAKQINPRTSGIRDVSSAAATFRREVEEVPALIREVDVNKLAARWASNTLKHAFLRDGFAQVENARDILVKRGFYKDAEYLSNWLTDNLGGVRNNTWRAAAQEFSNTLLNIRDNASADSQLRRISEWMLEGGANTSMRLFGSVYPNFLGFNIRSALQNLSQPILMTAPELGAKGMEYSMRALKNCAVNPKEAIQAGGMYRAAQWSTELSTVLEANLRRSWIGKASDKTIDTYAKISMAMYESAERANRVIVVQMGKELTKDVLAGNEAARRYVQKLNPGMRNAVKEAVAANDSKLVEELLVNNLLDKTIFQYNKLSMSNFGRAAGPILSTFSKWPTAIAGDVIDAYARKGVGQGSKELFGRYMLPLAMLGMANMVLTEDSKMFGQDDPQMQALIGGKKGLTGLSPLMSLTQGIGVPPIVVSVGKFGKALLDGDIDKAGSALASIGDAYIPMIPGALRAMNDVTKLTTGDENEVKSLETLFEAVTE